ncbi:Stress-response protein [Paramixta manurensis]|uniref:Stress-response protein n=1 Tax=Paramixta manurensis TaxID=2740817 RepID=A0A6M8UDJ9_9GAMM|nr:Stress-response protein [Erwiniaceae bacterium PD-1]
MNSDIVVGKWKQLKGQMTQWWAEWFDDDSAWMTGNNDWLSGILQEDYGKRQEGVSSEETPH